jgi:hypothetical protein
VNGRREGEWLGNIGKWSESVEKGIERAWNREGCGGINFGDWGDLVTGRLGGREI